MTAVPIEVHATDPPSMCVKVLKCELFLDVWNPLHPTWVLICIRGNQLMAVYGVASGCPAAPALPVNAFPLAEVHVSPCAAVIREADIFQLQAAL